MKRAMPAKLKILNYWQSDLTIRKYWIDTYRGSKERAFSICWACGCDAGTERAHIKAKCNGGQDIESNLHLLCKDCHLESELFEGEIYNKWFIWKTPETSGSWLRLWNKAAFLASHYPTEAKRMIQKQLT